MRNLGSSQTKEQRQNDSQGLGGGPQSDQDCPLDTEVWRTSWGTLPPHSAQQQREDERLFTNQIQIICFIYWSGNGLHLSSSFWVLTHTHTHLYPGLAVGGRDNLTLSLGTAIHAHSFTKDVTSAAILGISILPKDTCDGGWGPGGQELDDGNDSKEKAECTH